MDDCGCIRCQLKRARDETAAWKALFNVADAMKVAAEHDARIWRERCAEPEEPTHD